MVSVTSRLRLFKNGVEIYRSHNTVLDAGLNIIGRRLLDSSFSTQMLYVMFVLASGSYTKTGVYAELSTTSHEQSFSWTFDLAATDTWTSMHLMKANTTNASDKCISSTTFSVTVSPADSMRAIFDINFTSNFINSSGLQVLGHRCFDPANSYAIPNYMSFYNSGAEQKRYLGTYSNISNSVHKLLATTDATITTDDMRLYSGASGGTSYASNAVTRTIPINERVGFDVTIANPSSVLTTV